MNHEDALALIVELYGSLSRTNAALSSTSADFATARRRIADLEALLVDLRDALTHSLPPDQVEALEDRANQALSVPA